MKRSVRREEWQNKLMQSRPAEQTIEEKKRRTISRRPDLQNKSRLVRIDLFA